MSSKRYEFLSSQIQLIPEKNSVPDAINSLDRTRLSDDVVNILKSIAPHPSESFDFEFLPDEVLSDPVIHFLSRLNRIPHVSDCLYAISYIYSFEARLPVLQRTMSNCIASMKELISNEEIVQLLSVVLAVVNYGRKVKGLSPVNWVPLEFLTSLSTTDSTSDEYVLMMYVFVFPCDW